VAEYEGRCACGAVEFEINLEPLVVHACHCRDCQCLTGSAFAVNLAVEASAVVTTSGAPVSVKLDSPSGQPQEVFFCKDCTTNLWSKYYSSSYDILFVRTGTLLDTHRLPKPIHIYTRSKQAWLELPAGAHVFTEYYDAGDVWPAASLERLSKLASAES